jgi:hypothetical protein
VIRAKLLLVVTILGLLALVIAACTPTSTPTLAPPSEELDESRLSTTPSNEQPEELVLSNALTRSCERNGSSGGFDNAGLAVGETAVNFTLKDIGGNTVSLADLLSEKPVVMVFGSFT